MLHESSYLWIIFTMVVNQAKDRYSSFWFAKHGTSCTFSSFVTGFAASVFKGGNVVVSVPLEWMLLFSWLISAANLSFKKGLRNCDTFNLSLNSPIWRFFYSLLDFQSFKPFFAHRISEFKAKARQWRATFFHHFFSVDVYSEDIDNSRFSV